jgi:hypothetical protein
VISAGLRQALEAIAARILELANGQKASAQEASAQKINAPARTYEALERIIREVVRSFPDVDVPPTKTKSPEMIRVEQIKALRPVLEKIQPTMNF